MTLLMPDPEEARALGLDHAAFRRWWAQNVLGLSLPEPDQQPESLTDADALAE